MAILKSTKAKLQQSQSPAQEVQERQMKVATKLEEVIGRPPEGAKETRLRAATAAAVSGTMTFKDAEKLFAVSHREIQNFIERVFPTEEDKYKFLEDSMIHSSMLATAQFQKTFGQLSAIDAARAATIFAAKATDIRKAREAGFKEAPINVTTIVALEKTLAQLTQQPPTVDV